MNGASQREIAAIRRRNTGDERTAPNVARPGDHMRSAVEIHKKQGAVLRGNRTTVQSFPIGRPFHTCDVLPIGHRDFLVGTSCQRKQANVNCGLVSLSLWQESIHRVTAPKRSLRCDASQSSSTVGLCRATGSSAETVRRSPS